MLPCENVKLVALAGVAQWVEWAQWAWEPKGCQFDSQSGHMPGLISS